MFGTDRTKDQQDAVPGPLGLPADIIVSPDATRPQRIPPGQSRTRKWPVLDASGPPRLDLEHWRFTINGLVCKNVEWTWQEFLALPRRKVFADFHCVTRWSRLGNLWEGVTTRELVRIAGGARPEAGLLGRPRCERRFRGWRIPKPSMEYILRLSPAFADPGS